MQVGGICLSTLGLILPSVVEIVIHYEQPDFNRFSWTLHKNVLIIILGVITFMIITYVSILEIIGKTNTHSN